MNNTSERLGNAVDVLASSDASLEKRLIWAFQTIAPLQGADFSIADLRAEFESLQSEWDRVPDPQRGSIAASVEAMSDADRKRCAERVVNLFERAVRAEKGSYTGGP